MVVQKFVMQLEAQLDERQSPFDLSDAIAWLADKGYDEQMGARPLGRVIQEHIKKPLADELLFGKLKQGGTVKVTVEGSVIIRNTPVIPGCFAFRWQPCGKCIVCMHEKRLQRG
jgi:ATP-dependent Clp protease ATP-binding subunit ClpA